MYLGNRFVEIEKLPTSGQFKLLSMEEQFDAVKSADAIFSGICVDYATPLENVRTLSDYRDYLSKNKDAVSIERCRINGLLNNVGMLKRYIFSFDQLPRDLNGSSQLHLRESLEMAIFREVTGLDCQIKFDVDKDSRRGEMIFKKVNRCASVPFYVTYEKGEGFDDNGEPVGVGIGTLHIDPELQLTLPHLGMKMNNILIAKAEQRFGVDIKSEFVAHAHELDSHFLTGLLSSRKDVVDEISGFVEKQGVRITRNRDDLNKEMSSEGATSLSR